MSILSVADVLLEMNISDTNQRAVALAEKSLKAAEGDIKRFLQYDPASRTHTEYLPRADANQNGRVSVWEVNSTSAFQRDVSGGSGDTLQLKNLPVRSITSLNIDYDGRFGQKTGAFAASTLKTEGEDYWLASEEVDSQGNSVSLSGIVYSHGLWSNTAGSIKVVYVAGFTEDEFRGNSGILDASPVWESVLDETIRRMKRTYLLEKKKTGIGQGPFASESLGDYSYSASGAAQDRILGSSSSLLASTVDKLLPFQNLGSLLGG